MLRVWYFAGGCDVQDDKRPDLCHFWLLSKGHVRTDAVHHTIDRNRFTLGGNENQASGLYSVVVGGKDNKASGLRATVSGGEFNEAGGDDSVVGGGLGNRAFLEKSVIPEGRYLSEGGQ